ncbi:hypothetical protein [Croceicoccus sp. YJ47]|uniref:hypothetical protein n=1 Tax=Croceicoccus sp. YJ47 TaxID=2798724 RepID=UPI0019221F87|nr:hypothetical protein [Croceicoccus sp. YJ47]QQN74250.1 hypothetical protein JD971_00020 [Croceicoccus sp. YJ47]
MPVSIAQNEADYPAPALQPDADGKLAYDDGTRVGYRGIIGAGKRARSTLGAGQGYARFDWHDARAEDGGLAASVQHARPRGQRGGPSLRMHRNRIGRLAKIMLDPGEGGRGDRAADAPCLRIVAGRWLALPEGECKVRVARHSTTDGISLTLGDQRIAAGTLIRRTWGREACGFPWDLQEPRRRTAIPGVKAATHGPRARQGCHCPFKWGQNCLTKKIGEHFQ